MIYIWHAPCNSYLYRNNKWELEMTTRLYLAGTTIWLIALANVADFNLMDHVQMLNLAGQSIGF
jgi:hypothetical protein